jgi:hypothetical protein
MSIERSKSSPLHIIWALHCAIDDQDSIAQTVCNLYSEPLAKNPMAAGPFFPLPTDPRGGAPNHEAAPWLLNTDHALARLNTIRAPLHGAGNKGKLEEDSYSGLWRRDDYPRRRADPRWRLSYGERFRRRWPSIAPGKTTDSF